MADNTSAGSAGTAAAVPSAVLPVAVAAAVTAGPSVVAAGATAAVPSAVVPVAVVAADVAAAAGPPVVAAGAAAAVPNAVLSVAVAAAVVTGMPVVAAGAAVAVPNAVVPVAVAAAAVAANNGGGGRSQEMCGKRVDGCPNHKVLNCTYGLCVVCCAASKRDPRCAVAKHYKKNTHT